MSHNTYNGIELFNSEMITTQSKKGTGTVWINRDRVAEVKDGEVKPLATLSEKYKLEGPDLQAFVVRELQRV